MKQEIKEIKEAMPNEKPREANSRKCQKLLTALLLILLTIVGLTNIIVGVVDIYGCGNAMLIPVMLILNGFLWLLPPLLVALLNYLGRHYGDDLNCLRGCLEKLFFFSAVCLIAGTIYTLVTVTQVKTLESLCTRSWLPPYALCVLVADWLCFVAFFRLFCTHPLSEEESSAQFKHLRNLPPLPWNRHRALRKC